MKNLTILLMLLSYYSIAQDQITCENGSCDYDTDLTISNDADEADFTKFNIESPSDNIEVVTTSGESPRNIRMSLEQGSITDSKDVSVNLSSNLTANDSGEVILFADTINDLNLTLNGRNGSDSTTASEICATEILAGLHGADVKNIFLSNRSSDPTLPVDKCVAKDLEDIQSQKFSCDLTFTENVNDQLTTTRWVKKKQCEGLAQRKMCVKRKVNISCRWNADRITGSSSGVCCDQGDPSSGEKKPPGGGVVGIGDWSCIPSLCDSDNNGWTILFPTVNMDESYVKDRRSIGMSDADICDEITGRDTSYLEVFPQLVNSYQFNRSGGITKSRSEQFYEDTDGVRAINLISATDYGNYFTESTGLSHRVTTRSNSRLISFEKFKGCSLSHNDGNIPSRPWQQVNLACDDRIYEADDRARLTGTSFSGDLQFGSSFSSRFTARTTLGLNFSESCSGFGGERECETNYSINSSRNSVNPGYWASQGEYARTRLWATSSGHYIGAGRFIRCYKSGNHIECPSANDFKNFGGLYGLPTSDFDTRFYEKNGMDWETSALYQYPNGRVVRIYFRNYIGFW